MKALEYLYKRLKYLEELDTPTEYDEAYKNGQIDAFEEAIAELEAMQNRSCDSCKHYIKQTMCYGCSRAHEDYWEAKDAN